MKYTETDILGRLQDRGFNIIEIMAYIRIRRNPRLLKLHRRARKWVKKVQSSLVQET